MRSWVRAVHRWMGKKSTFKIVSSQVEALLKNTGDFTKKTMTYWLEARAHGSLQRMQIGSCDPRRRDKHHRTYS